MIDFRGMRACTRWIRLAACAAVLAGLGACASTEDAATKDAPETLYAEAKAEMAAGSWENAAKLLTRVESRASGSLLGQQAQLDLAYTQWKQGDKAEALSTLDRFIRFYPSSPGSDYALYLRGLVNFNDNLGILGSISGQKLSERDQQASRDAYQSFKELVERFPDSRYTPDARERMNFVVNSLSEYEVVVARYYLRRGAYLAAANRAQQALINYPQTPAIEPALAVMMQAYDRLNLPQLRDDARRVLALNYPESRYLSGDSEGEEEPWWQLW